MSSIQFARPASPFCTGMLLNPLLSFQRFESDMKKSMSQFQSELERLQKAKQEGLFNYTDNEGLEKKWNYLKTRWNTLGKEHLKNRNRWELSDHFFEIHLSNTVTGLLVCLYRAIPKINAAILCTRR